MIKILVSKAFFEALKEGDKVTLRNKEELRDAKVFDAVEFEGADENGTWFKGNGVVVDIEEHENGNIEHTVEVG